MKKINLWLEKLLAIAVKIIYREKIEDFFTRIGNETHWQLVTNPVLIPVKKGKRKYYLFEYMDGDGKHVAWINRNDFKREGDHLPIEIKTTAKKIDNPQSVPLRTALPTHIKVLRKSGIPGAGNSVIVTQCAFPDKKVIFEKGDVVTPDDVRGWISDVLPKENGEHEYIIWPVDVGDDIVSAIPFDDYLWYRGNEHDDGTRFPSTIDFRPADKESFIGKNCPDEVCEAR